MSMKILTISLTCILLAGCRQSDAPVQINAELRTESQEFTNARVGKVRMDTTYRGDERILMVMSYSNVTTRSFCLHGAAVYIESDEDGDGFFESLMIPGETMGDFEQFDRLPDGGVEPISKDDYLELKQEVDQATELMNKAFKEVHDEIE